MKRVIQPRGVALWPIVIYREDIERMVQILREMSPNVEVSTNEYHLDNLSELFELKHNFLTNLQLRTLKPHIEVDFQEDKVVIHIEEDTMSARGASETLKQLLIKRTPLFFQFVRSKLLYNIAFAFCFFSFINFGYAIIDIFFDNLSWTRLTAYGISLLATGGLCLYLLALPDVKIFLKYRNEVPSFWSRNSDKVLLIIISAVTGSLLTLLVKFLTEKTK